MKDPKRAADELSREVAKAFGNRLRSAVLYGSAARGEYIDGSSDINVLLLFDDIDPALLQRAAPLARRWASERLAALPLESEEWARAADVFAIEVLDMQDAHVLLEGDDPVRDLEVSRSALRLQTERELRVKLIALHTGMLVLAERPQELGELLAAAVPSLVTYLRAALRLADQPVPARSAEVIHSAAAQVGFDPSGLLEALEARSGRRAWKASITEPNVILYNEAAERTAGFVDRIVRNDS